MHLMEVSLAAMLKLQGQTA